MPTTAAMWSGRLWTDVECGRATLMRMTGAIWSERLWTDVECDRATLMPTTAAHVKPTLTGWSNRWTRSWRLVLPLRWGWLNLRCCCRSCFGVYWHLHRLAWRPWRCWNACYCWHWRLHLGRQSRLEKQGRGVCCSRNADVGSVVEYYLDS